MCGLAGALRIYKRSDLDLLEIVKKMNNKLKNRGPDDEGYWVNEEKTIALAHRRLSIMELSKAGSQPMISFSGRYILVFNGEIYNHTELREEIQNEQTFKEIKKWKGGSDTETLITAISIWGFHKTIKKLIGMFSIACWDKEENILFLSRDRIGEKPLYYTFNNKLLLFASELDAIEEVNHLPFRINKTALKLYLSCNFIPSPYTIYEGINKLKPGSYLKIRGDEFTEKLKCESIVYWDLENQLIKRQIKKNKIDDIKIVNHIEFLLKNSIKRQMNADVSLGAFLSGGIDSSLVVAIMQSISSEKIKTFTLGFQEKEFDESLYAKNIANYLGTDHTEFKLKAEEAIKIIEKLPEVYDEPFADVSQIPMIIISKLARKKVKVCLSGDGGDEIFGGYNRYIFTKNFWRLLKIIPLPLRFLLSRIFQSISLKKIKKILNLFGKVIPQINKINILEEKITKIAKLLKAKNSSELYSLICFENSPNEILNQSKESISESNLYMHNHVNIDLVHNMMIQDLKAYLPDDVLVKIDRASMYYSLETRLPFLDINLINYAFNIPTSQKIKLFKGKWPLRKLLKSYLPSKLFERPKVGFSVPISDWLRGPLKNWAENLLDPRLIEKDGYFNSKLITQKWHEHISGKKNWSNILWSIIIFQLWLDHRKKR